MLGLGWLTRLPRQKERRTPRIRLAGGSPTSPLLLGRFYFQLFCWLGRRRDADATLLQLVDDHSRPSMPLIGQFGGFRHEPLELEPDLFRFLERGFLAGFDRAQIAALAPELHRLEAEPQEQGYQSNDDRDVGVSFLDRAVFLADLNIRRSLFLVFHSSSL